MSDFQLEIILLCISTALAVICLIIGLLRGLKSANILGGGVMSMVMTWLIFIAILVLAYNIIYFSSFQTDIGELKYLSNIFIILIPICVLRIIWGFADYVKELKKLSE